jgi:CheY-like chemotaxis protein
MRASASMSQTNSESEAFVASKFLVVDDCEDGADSMKTLLEMQGFEASCVYDGKSAVERVRTEVPDVILMDLGMRGLDGFDTAMTIRQILPAGTTTLAAVTGWATAAVRDRATAAGFNCFFVKPIDIAVMLSTLTAMRPLSIAPVEPRCGMDRRSCERSGNERRQLSRLGADRRKSSAVINL